MKRRLILAAAAVVILVLFVVIQFSKSDSSSEQVSEQASEQSSEESQSTGEADGKELVVYAYDSFASEWGPGPQVVELFEQEYGIPVRLVSIGDAGQVLQRAILEKDDPQADILVGIDNNLITRAKESGVLQPYSSPNLKHISEELLFDDELYVTPYDYGYFSIIYDTEKIDSPPRSLEELTEPRFEDQLILMDPRTSSPGLGFLMWTVQQYGDRFDEYWDRLEPSILTITEGWDSGYGLFTNGEAPMVLSYTTSPAYHVEYEDSMRYQAAIFDEGHYMQIEGMGIVAGAANPEAARKFIDFSLSEEFQSVIPLTNWMYPVRESVELPESYDYAPKAGRSLSFSGEEIAENREQWINAWTKTVTN